MNPNVLAGLIAAGVSLVVFTVGWWFTRRRDDRSRRIKETHREDEIEDRALAFFGRVRDLRSEVQNVQRLAREIKEGKRAVADHEEIFKSNSNQIEDLIGKVRTLLEQDPNLYDFYGDQVANIENFWQRAFLSWPSSEDTEQVPRKITLAIEELEKIVFCSGILTIPNRVRQHLRQQRVGNLLDFHEYFSDELPKMEDRLLILRYMQSHPALVDGVVSVEDGLIYAASPNQWRRYASFGMVLLAAFAGFVAVWFACQLTVIRCDQAGGFTELRRAYLLILVGAVAHVLVEFLKRDRASKANASGLHDWFVHFHVKEISFLQAATSLWLGLLLLVYFVDEPIEAETAFLLGYSIDSFLDLFLQRFTKKISAGTQALQRQLQSSGSAEAPKS